MQKYELVLLLNASLQEKERQETISTLLNGLHIVQKDEIGLKTTSYDLERKKGNDKFYFYSYQIEASSEDLNSIKQQLVYNKIVARYFIFKMNATEEFFKFDELNATLEKLLDREENKKTGQKVSFFMKKANKKYLTWKSIPVLKKYITRFGNIKPRKYTHNTVLTQKALKDCVIRAREIGMLEYIK